MKYKNNLLYKLEQYSKDGLAPFHMPGHKRNNDKVPHIDPYMMDITEIDGFDDLNHPEGLFLDAEKRAARIFGSKKTYFLINGCTAGILASVTAICNNKKKILLAANSHRSAYNAAYINKLEFVFAYPDEDERISADDVEKILEENDDIGCVFITSPTYTGVVSDIRGIAEAAHKYGVPLIVDEAHGAHMGFNDIFPENALAAGADVVIHGIHKTLPSLTQTALLHVNSDMIDTDEMERKLKMFQSSSPSYILTGAIDHCMDYLECDGEKDFEEYAANLRSLYEKLEGLKVLKAMPYSSKRDASKIVIVTKGAGINGLDLYNYLRQECGIQPEMSMPDYVILMTSVWDDAKDLENLAEKLLQEDREFALRIKADRELAAGMEEDKEDKEKKKSVPVDFTDNIQGKKSDVSGRNVPDFKALVGKTAEDMVYLYPPGVPIVLPGEVFTEEQIEILKGYAEKGYNIKGLKYGGYDI